MKRMVLVMIPLGLLAFATGCDPTDLSSVDKALIAAQGMDPAGVGATLSTQMQTRLHAMDGSGDGYQHQYGGAAAGSGNGQCGGDQLRLRDGSCGDGGNGSGQGGGDQLRLRDGSCQNQS